MWARRASPADTILASNLCPCRHCRRREATSRRTSSSRSGTVPRACTVSMTLMPCPSNITSTCRVLTSAIPTAVHRRRQLSRVTFASTDSWLREPARGSSRAAAPATAAARTPPPRPRPPDIIQTRASRMTFACVVLGATHRRRRRCCLLRWRAVVAPLSLALHRNNRPRTMDAIRCHQRPRSKSIKL